eukprot:6197793-Pleurochrysis_carterae.AAC.3
MTRSSEPEQSIDDSAVREASECAGRAATASWRGVGESRAQAAGRVQASGGVEDGGLGRGGGQLHVRCGDEIGETLNRNI